MNYDENAATPRRGNGFYLDLISLDGEIGKKSKKLVQYLGRIFLYCRMQMQFKVRRACTYPRFNKS